MSARHWRQEQSKQPIPKTGGRIVRLFLICLSLPVNLKFIIECYRKACKVIGNAPETLSGMERILSNIKVPAGFPSMNNNVTYIHSITNFILSLGGWSYILLALVVSVEGPLATLAGAVAASAGLLNPILVFASASVGNLTADTVWYSVGYLGKTEWLVKYGHWFGLKKKLIDQLEKDIQTHIRKILFAAKLTLGFVVPTLIATGLARIPMKRWFGALFTAECIWTGGLVLAGYYFGTLTQRIASNLRWVSLAGAAIFLILGLIYISHRKSNLENE